MVRLPNGAKSVAAPATVSARNHPSCHWPLLGAGKADGSTIRKPGDLPSRDVRAETAGRGDLARLISARIFAVTLDVGYGVTMLYAAGRQKEEHGRGFRNRVVRVYGLVAALNIGAWAWAIFAFNDVPALLGIALVIYGLGLRHGADADHIAAIDNVTRKLMQEGKRPVSAGLFFAIGHSAVVTFVTAAAVTAAASLEDFAAIQSMSGTIATIISAVFLLVIAIMNAFVFRSVYRTFRNVRDGGVYSEQDNDRLLASRGLLTRLFRPLFKLVSKSWHMFPLGFLLGLGFDTATEVAMFGVSVSQAARGVPFEAIMVFPFLFAAGMALVDTTDGVMMIGAYNWAFVKPVRKLYYNMTITLVSIAVALLVGGVEVLGLIGDRFSLTGSFWDMVAALNGNFNNLGFAMIGVFLFAWLASYLIYKVKRIDEITVPVRA